MDYRIPYWTIPWRTLLGALMIKSLWQMSRPFVWIRQNWIGIVVIFLITMLIQVILETCGLPNIISGIEAYFHAREMEALNACPL